MGPPWCAMVATHAAKDIMLRLADWWQKFDCRNVESRNYGIAPLAPGSSLESRGLARSWATPAKHCNWMSWLCQRPRAGHIRIIVTVLF